MTAHDITVIIGCILWSIWCLLFGYFVGLAKGRGEPRKHVGYHVHKVEREKDDGDWWKGE